jgi:competence protein ComEC
VDYLIVTHPRIDHYGGMRAILDEFSPAEFWSGTARGLTGRFDDLDAALERAKIQRVSLGAGQACRVIDKAEICVLYPPSGGSVEHSIVLRLEFGKLRYLFASDIDKRDEAQLPLADEIRSAVLKVPRHGSPTASSAVFVAAAAPRLAIVSAGGRRNETGREEVLERYRAAGAEVLRTADDGAVIVESDGKRVRFSGYRSGRRGEFELHDSGVVQRVENTAKN